MCQYKNVTYDKTYFYDEKHDKIFFKLHLNSLKCFN